VIRSFARYDDQTIVNQMSRLPSLVNRPERRRTDELHKESGRHRSTGVRGAEPLIPRLSRRGTTGYQPYTTYTPIHLVVTRVHCTITQNTGRPHIIHLGWGASITGIFVWGVCHYLDLPLARPTQRALCKGSCRSYTYDPQISLTPNRLPPAALRRIYIIITTLVADHSF